MFRMKFSYLSLKKIDQNDQVNIKEILSKYNIILLLTFKSNVPESK